MSEIWKFFLAALACFRLAELFAFDEGPLKVFLMIRNMFGAYELGENGEPKRAWGRLIICPFCIGLWFTLAATLLLWWGSSPQHMVLIWLALAGAQAAIEDRVGRS